MRLPHERVQINIGSPTPPGRRLLATLDEVGICIRKLEPTGK